MSVFCFNDPATTEIYALSLHDALPISPRMSTGLWWLQCVGRIWSSAIRVGEDSSARAPPALIKASVARTPGPPALVRSEEHTPELQSHLNLVCLPLLQKKKQPDNNTTS